MSYIYLDRKILKHWTYKSKPFNKSMAWIDLLLIADHTDHISLWRGKPTLFKRGDVNISILELSKRWGWSRDKTTRFLLQLERDNMIRINATTYRTTLTIVKYEDFQVKPATDKARDKTTDKARDKATDKATDRTHLSNTSNAEVMQKDIDKPSPAGAGSAIVRKVEGGGDMPDGWTQKLEDLFAETYEKNSETYPGFCRQILYDVGGWDEEE